MSSEEFHVVGEDGEVRVCHDRSQRAIVVEEECRPSLAEPPVDVARADQGGRTERGAHEDVRQVGDHYISARGEQTLGIACAVDPDHKANELRGKHAACCVFERDLLFHASAPVRGLCFGLAKPKFDLILS